MPHTPLTVENIGQIANRYYQHLPDLRESARDWAIKLLKFHTNQDLDPDETYWHDFDNAQNNALAFTGQQHIGKPKETLTVTELVLRRFNTFYQVNFDLLDQMSGFYKVKDAGLYNQTNEVPLAPSSIMKEFWTTDFSTHYQRRLDAFLKDYASDGRVVIKVLFFGLAWNAYNTGSLSSTQLKLVFDVFAGPTSFPPTLEDMQALHVDRKLADVRTFTLGDVTARDVLRITTTVGPQILYMPAGWFKSFHNEQQMYDWVAETAADEHARERLLGHFDRYDPASQAQYPALIKTLERIRTTPWAAGQRLLNGASTPITEDVFSYLFDSVRKRLRLDAYVLLTSNHELRKELFVVDLETFMRLVTPLAPGDPAVAVVAVAAGSIAFGTHLATAVHGKTKQSRQAAFRAAIVDALNILLDMPLLRGAGEVGRSSLSELASSVDLAESDLAQVDMAVPGNSALEAIATGEDLTGMSEGSGKSQGVYTRADGNQYIHMDGKVFQVRYINGLERWLIVDPIAPLQITGSWPVQRDWLDRWELFSITLPTTDLPTLDTLAEFDTTLDFRDITQILVSPNSRQLMSGAIDRVMLGARSELIRLRVELSEQAQAFFAEPQAQHAPSLPPLTPLMTPKQFLQDVFAHSKGLIINEASDTNGSCQLLVKYMSTLKAQQVRTLYVQGLSKDLHQDLIDQFQRTGRFSRNLDKQLQRLHNLNPHLDSGRYSLRRVLIEARRQGIAVKGLDCAASLAGDGLPAPAQNLAHRMRVYYAFKRIEALQSAKPEERWVALTDQTLANHYLQTPGLANLAGMPSLRVKVGQADLPLRFSLDTGEVLKPALIPIKGDISLRMPSSAADIADDPVR